MESDIYHVMDKTLLSSIEGKKRELDKLRPLPPSIVQKLKEQFLIEWTYNSNAIEGNTLTLQETELVLNRGLTIGNKSLKEHFEAINHKECIELVEKFVEKKEDLNAQFIKQLHKIILKNIDDYQAGVYRKTNVRILGAVHIPPDASKIERLMDEFLDWYYTNKHQIPVPELAAWVQYKFVYIHPFIDGNGRVARLLTNLYLMARDYPPVILKKEDRGKYYKSLRAADSGNLEPFANFIAKAVDENMTLYLSISGGNDELLPLRELAIETPYSQEYLSLRARQGLLDAVKIGKTWHSSKRAIEQYLSEHGKKDV